MNPNYATIYLGNNKSIDYEGRVHKWVDKIYKSTPPEDMSWGAKDRRTPWRVIGHVDLKAVINTHIQTDETGEVNDEK